ncbi:MAG: 30S ribosomal protein S6 [Gemmatimonadota bacterium]|nr:30S ribosomal protein S6 [Gemmatimonadota bacterium]
MSKRYELTLIVNPQAADGAVDDLVARFDRLVSDGGGRSVEVNRLGARKLAYDIGRQNRGDYTFIRFAAPPEALPEIDRAFKLEESVLRHMVVLDESPVEEEPEEVEEDGADDNEAEDGAKAAGGDRNEEAS